MTFLVGADCIRPPCPASNKIIKAHTDLPVNLRSNAEPGANIKGGRRAKLPYCFSNPVSSEFEEIQASRSFNKPSEIA